MQMKKHVVVVNDSMDSSRPKLYILDLPTDDDARRLAVLQRMQMELRLNSFVRMVKTEPTDMGVDLVCLGSRFFSGYYNLERTNLETSYIASVYVCPIED